MRTNKNREANIKIFIIPFLVITLIVVTTAFAMSNSIKKYFYDVKKEEALKISRNISRHLTTAGEMADTINQLLDENLLISLKTMAISKDNNDHELFTELANAFEFDEVYIYNSDRIIEYSKSGKYIGWQAYEGHPVNNFILSDKTVFVEDFRQDSDGPLYYKYGYIKTSDGFIIQIGILADKYRDLMELLSLQNILEDAMVDDTIVQLFSLNKEFIVTASTDKGFIGSKIDQPLIMADINGGKTHEFINGDRATELYEIFVPLEYRSDKIVAFGIQYSMRDILPVIRANTTIFLVASVIVYLSLLFSMFIIHNRNKKLVQLAYYDTTTGLPNTESLKKELNEEISRGKGYRAILMIRCDNLEIVNLTFGYEYGDVVLKELGNRLKQLEHKNVQPFRFYEGNFVLHIKCYKDKKDLLALIDKTNKLLNHPFIINNTRENYSFSMGIMEYSKAGKTIDEILKDATIALNNVDDSEANNYKCFDEDMELLIHREDMIEKEIKAAINEPNSSNIYLVYQPILDIKNNSISGFEALARMESNQFGFVSPVEFIGIAERKRFIIPLSNFILKRACSYISGLLRMGFDDIRVAVNISAIHILREDFVSTVLSIIRETGIKGKNLELEITETVLVDNYSVVNERLKKLRANDIKVSLDDFGTGYSSFSRLAELNVDTLKIDQSFISSITDDNKTSLIVGDIISIAHRLGLKTVAEGVELQEHMDYLLECNCDMLQGYLFSKPLLEEDATNLLKKTRDNKIHSD